MSGVIYSAHIFQEPMFFHCEQGANTNASHCGKGMVGIINPHGLKNFPNFQRRALEVGVELGAVNSSVLHPHGVWRN